MLLQLHQAFQKLESGIDDSLQSYFTRTTAIEELASFDSQRVIAVGLKGIGKTASFRYFTEFEKTPDIVIGIETDKFSLYLPQKDLNYNVCRKQFEHDIAIECLNQIKEHRAALTSKVGKFYLDAAADEVRSYLKILNSLAGRFGGLSVLGCGFTIHHPVEDVVIGLRKQTEVSNALRILKEICAKGVKIRIVVDDPEWVFSAKRQLDTHLIGGFCMAALRLSSAIPGLKVIPLLKTHVYYPILNDVDDLGKYPDHMERLCWVKEELVEVVNTRLKWAKTPWAEFFAGTEKQGRKVIEEMCAYVRNGPRDLLRWLDLCLKETKGGKISKAVTEKTHRAMSLDSFHEFVAAHNRYQKIGEVLKCIFRNDPEHKYTLPELQKSIADLLINNAEMKALSQLEWMQWETSRTLPELFFKSGVLALERNGRLVLPYEEGYDSEGFRTATSLRLVPALVPAID